MVYKLKEYLLSGPLQKKFIDPWSKGVSVRMQEMKPVHRTWTIAGVWYSGAISTKHLSFRNSVPGSCHHPPHPPHPAALSSYPKIKNRGNNYNIDSLIRNTIKLYFVYIFYHVPCICKCTKYYTCTLVNNSGYKICVLEAVLYRRFKALFQGEFWHWFSHAWGLQKLTSKENTTSL